MTTKTSIGLVTPSFNQACYLEATIQSVLQDEYPGLQYAIVDGGSTDGSVDIIRKYQGRLHYWISEPDGGQSEAINKGLRSISADVVGWLNSDDLYLPGALRLVGNMFASNPHVQVILGRTIFTDADLNIIRACCHPRVFGFLSTRGVFYFSQQSMFWRRDLLERIGYLDENLHTCMDMDLWIRFIRMRAKIKTVPHFLSVWRLHDNCKSCKTGWGAGPAWDRDRETLKNRYADMRYSRPTRSARLFYYALKLLTGAAFSAMLFQARWKQRPLAEFIQTKSL